MTKVILLTVKCGCGSEQTVDLGRQSRARNCQKCGAPLKDDPKRLVRVTTIDERRQNPRK